MLLPWLTQLPTEDGSLLWDPRPVAAGLASSESRYGREAAIHERGGIRSSHPPTVRGQPGRHSRGPALQPGGLGSRLEPTWLSEARSLGSQPIPAPLLPEGSWSDPQGGS